MKRTVMIAPAEAGAPVGEDRRCLAQAGIPAVAGTTGGAR
jgi:hypothetical protein